MKNAFRFFESVDVRLRVGLCVCIFLRARERKVSDRRKRKTDREPKSVCAADDGGCVCVCV